MGSLWDLMLQKAGDVDVEPEADLFVQALLQTDARLVEEAAKSLRSQRDANRRNQAEKIRLHDAARAFFEGANEKLFFRPLALCLV